MLSWLPPKVNRFVVVEDVDVHVLRTHIDDRHGLPGPAVGQQVSDLLVGGLRGKGLDVHDQRLESSRLDCGHAVLDLFLARGGEQDLHVVRAAG